MRFADDEGPDHCWHSTNIVLTSNPPQHPQICCLCGAKRHMTSRASYESGHGPYADPIERYETIYYYQDELGEQPCLAKN